jgi:hypothetical protein
MSQSFSEPPVEATAWVEVLRSRVLLHAERRAITYLIDGEEVEESI